MAELFCGATLRHLPHLHPLHQVYNFRLPSPNFIHPLSLQMIVFFFFLEYVLGVYFRTVVDATCQDFTADQPSSSSLHAGCWWRVR